MEEAYEIIVFMRAYISHDKTVKLSSTENRSRRNKMEDSTAHITHEYNTNIRDKPRTSSSTQSSRNSPKTAKLSNCKPRHFHWLNAESHNTALHFNTINTNYNCRWLIRIDDCCEIDTSSQLRHFLWTAAYCWNRCAGERALVKLLIFFFCYNIYFVYESVWIVWTFLIIIWIDFFFVKVRNYV